MKGGAGQAQLCVHVRFLYTLPIYRDTAKDSVHSGGAQRKSVKRVY